MNVWLLVAIAFVAGGFIMPTVLSKLGVGKRGHN